MAVADDRQDAAINGLVIAVRELAGVTDTLVRESGADSKLLERVARVQDQLNDVAGEMRG